MKLAKTATCLLMAMLLTASSMPVGAADATELGAMRGNWPHWAKIESSCQVNSTGQLADGKYALPATKGYMGYEAPVDQDGNLTTTGRPVAFPQHAKLGQEYRDYYITMRWLTFKWYWGGAPPTAPEAVLVDNEQVKWMGAKPRMVLVTNPRTNLSIIAVALESGPAPFAGVDDQKNDIPKGSWQQPQLGTPTDYKGRVSGLPPVARDAIGAVQRTGGLQDGDELLYAWAPDGSKPGPTSLRVDDATSGGGGACANGGLGVSPDGFVFPLKTTKARLKNNPYWSPNCRNKVSSMGALGSVIEINGLCHHDYLAADIQTDSGTVAVAPRPGRVIGSGHSDNCIFHNVKIYSDPALGGDGNTYYLAHLNNDKIPKGRVVEKGDTVGTIYPAGNCFQSHLHIDISPTQVGFSRGSHGTEGPVLDPQPALKAAYENLPEN